MREGDPYTYAPSVWDYLIKRLALRSVLDLGCGMGHASAYFHSAGLQVVAVDGLAENVEKSLYPSVLIDLEQSRVTCRVDLVHCQEVVEHVEERYLPNLLASLACGQYILMTNALPSQGGFHHVNEQPTEYWIEHLKTAGFTAMGEDTRRVRELAARDGATYLAKTGLVLVKAQI